MVAAKSADCMWSLAEVPRSMQDEAGHDGIFTGVVILPTGLPTSFP